MSRYGKVGYSKITGRLTGVPEGHAIRLTKGLTCRYDTLGVDPLAEYVPERATHIFALHPDNWEWTFLSLTGKDRNKIGRYGAVAIEIVPGTLVVDMYHANRFLREGEGEVAARDYVASLKRIEEADVKAYQMPELLIPRVR